MRSTGAVIPFLPLKSPQGLPSSETLRLEAAHRIPCPYVNAKTALDGKTIEQKLRYMHANPVSKKWRLADDAVEYPHSSFAFYVKGDARHAPLTSYQEFGYLVL